MRTETLDIRASAAIDGEITNRVRANKTGTRRTKGSGAGEVVRAISASREAWEAIDAAAKSVNLGRSEFLRRAAMLVIEQLAVAHDKSTRACGAVGCGARSATCTSR